MMRVKLPIVVPLGFICACKSSSFMPIFSSPAPNRRRGHARVFPVPSTASNCQGRRWGMAQQEDASAAVAGPK